MRRRTLLARALAATGGLLAARPAAAQAWPSRTVRIVVPYPAGGGTDYVARLFGERLAKSFGQPFIIDNRSGAAGAIGVAEVAKAEPDGHTLLLTIGDPLMNNVALFRQLPYDPQRDLQFVAQLLRSPTLISASTGAGIRSFDDLRRLAAQGARLSYGSWGVGGLGHLQGETLNRELKAGMVHVPQRGEGPVVQDLLGNTISIGLSSVGTARTHVQAGKIVPLAVLYAQRLPALPQVPTMGELGFKDPIFESSVWMALLLPARTPTAVAQRLGDEVRTIAGATEVRALLAERGFEVMASSAEQAQGSLRAEFDIVTRRIRELGIEPQ